MKVYAFGGSWAYGSELDFNKEFPFVKHFSEKLGCNYVNYGEEGAGAGLVLRRISENACCFQEDDIVLVIVPPDVRWYSESANRGFYPIGINDDEYKSFIGNKSLDWFVYHHALFIFSIQNLLEFYKVKYIMAFDCGSAESLDYPGIPIDKNKFVSDQDLLSILSNKTKLQGRVWLGYTFLEDGPSKYSFKGKYFKGKLQHPNELGHKKIAEIFLNSYNKIYK